MKTEMSLDTYPGDLIHYIRDKRTKQPRGVVIATKINEKQYGIGWSFTNTKAGDRFDKELGLRIARGRCTHATNKIVPIEISHSLSNMEKRAHRYFKHMNRFKPF